jgi:hypothetical protein
MDSAAGSPSSKMASANHCMAICQLCCSSSQPANSGAVNVPTPVPAEARPEARLRSRMNQRCTATRAGT